MTTKPIDAVIMWVDGDDPALALKRTAYLEDAGSPGSAPTRFASMNEVVYCALSILKYAPFFENIYIVTDNQTPPVFEAVARHFPAQAHKIKVVDHTEIFRGFEDFLPLFNSTSIIMGLQNIPDLNEHFVFFNDDFILVRPLSPEDFFVGNKPVLRGGWMGRSLDYLEGFRQWLDNARKTPQNRRRFSSKRWMLKAARLAGMQRRTFIATHAPYPMRVSTLHAYEQAHPDIWRENMRHRFRAADQFVVEALANHLELAQNNAAVKDRHALVYIRANRIKPAKLARKLARASTDETIKFLCVQNLDEAAPPAQSCLINWLDTHIMPLPPAAKDP